MKNQKGITVLSLVIAIVVLAALIGVSFAMLFNDNEKVANANQQSVTSNTTNTTNEVEE